MRLRIGNQLRKGSIALLTLALLLVSSTQAIAAAPVSKPPATPLAGRTGPIPGRHDYARAAREFVGFLTGAFVAKAVGRFDDRMQAALPEQELAEILRDIGSKAGQFQSITGIHVERIQQGAVVDLECRFAKECVNIRVTLDARLKVAGLFFLPGWNPPAYANQARFKELELSIGDTSYPLPATLSLPHGRGPFPVVVLVHGSGPHDRDETLGPNKPFKDLAWGLASQGIAALRFEKRTEHYRESLSDRIRTVKEESIEDVRFAIDSLEKTSGIDRERIIVVGHSLGAMLAPRIAAGDARVRGIALLAGPTRPEGQILLDQTRYLASLSRAPEADRQEWIRQATETARTLDRADLSPSEIVEGIPGEYWIDMRNQHGVKFIGELEIPVLVLQGGRDYQVTLEDFDGWKHALAHRDKATFQIYPDLNHLFMHGQGPATPDEYEVPNHVSGRVVDDVAQWIRQALPSPAVKN